MISMFTCKASRYIEMWPRSQRTSRLETLDMYWRTEIKLKLVIVRIKKQPVCFHLISLVKSPCYLQWRIESMMKKLDLRSFWLSALEVEINETPTERLLQLWNDRRIHQLKGFSNVYTNKDTKDRKLHYNSILDYFM